MLGCDVVEVRARYGEARMTELPLDQIDRDILSNKVGSVAMPKAVSVNTLFNPGLLGQPRQ
jgi:hypothetical protein